MDIDIDPVKNFVPRQNAAKKPSSVSVSDETKIDITDKEQLRKLAITTLVRVIQANPKALAVVPALKELFDRIDGKAPQSLLQTINGNISNTIQIIRFSDLPAPVDNLIIEHVDK